MSSRGKVVINSLAVLGLLGGVAQAGIYKCQEDGRTVYQQSPCANGSEINVTPRHRQETPAGSMDREARSRYLLQREIDRREYEIEYDHQAEIGRLQRRMKREIAALKAKKKHAANNLAGATWAQSISEEMQAVSDKYRVLIDGERDDIRRLRDEISELRDRLQRNSEAAE